MRTTGPRTAMPKGNFRRQGTMRGGGATTFMAACIRYCAHMTLSDYDIMVLLPVCTVLTLNSIHFHSQII